MFVPQVTPLDWGEIGVAQIEGRLSPAAVGPERSQQWVVIPPGVADYRGGWQVGGGIQQVGKQCLTWEQTAPSVDWLASVVESHFGGTWSKFTNLKNNL